MSITAARKSDASSIAALSIEVWIGTYLRQGVSARFADYALDTFTTAKIEAELSDPRQFTLVSQSTDGIDGFIRIHKGKKSPLDDCSEAEIATFYVQRRHQGKGIGTRLLNAALEQCRESGIRSVWLATNAENTPAIEFYLRAGFEIAGETLFRIGTEAFPNTVFTYRLA